MNTNIKNEQINDLPLLIGLMEDMGIRQGIDGEVARHGNWQGLSMGTVVEIWLRYLLTEQNHRLVGVRTWANERAETLKRLLGEEVRDTELSDDRLATVLTRLSEESIQQAIDQRLVGQWLVAYELPTETARLDSTSVSLYAEGDDEDSLLQRGYSKDHRPDLAQFKVMLSTLDPLGLPLAGQVVSGEQADDGLYVPAYERLVKTLGRRAVLVVGDSKMAARSTRGHMVRGGSAYLCSYRPVGNNADLTEWVEQALAQPSAWQEVTTVSEATGEIQTVAQVYAWSRPQQWQAEGDPTVTTWTERILLVRSEALRQGLLQKADQRLARLRQALELLRRPPAKGRRRYRTAVQLQEKVDQLMKHYHLPGVLHIPLVEQQTTPGNPRWLVGDVQLDQAAWDAYQARLGWHIYLTNTTQQHYDLPALLWTYRHQVFIERGFARLKTRRLHIRPVYLRDEQRITALTWLLLMALRVLTLTEFRLRTQLQHRQQTLVGLNLAVPSQPTSRPTTERVLFFFRHLTLTLLQRGEVTQTFVSSLSDTHLQILSLLNLPLDLYARLATSPPFLVLSLPES
jgi:transposase